jgi:hypothetical protein
MGALATQLIRYMINQGSNLKIFAAYPSLEFSSENLPVDEAGQLWPRYAYTSGRVFHLWGVERVIAVPMKSVLRELPYATALYHKAEATHVE